MKIEFEIDLDTKKRIELDETDEDRKNIPSKIKIISSENKEYTKCLEEICSTLFGLGYGWSTQTNHLVEIIIQNRKDHINKLVFMLMKASEDSDTIGWFISQSKPLTEIREKLFDQLKEEGMDMAKMREGYNTLGKYN